MFWVVWPSNEKKKKQQKTKQTKNDQINENKMLVTSRPNVRKWNFLVIWMIVNNDFYEYIWKQTHLIPLLNGMRYPFSAWTTERAWQTCPIVPAAAVVKKKRLSTPSTTASEFTRSGITSGSGRLASNPSSSCCSTLVTLWTTFFLCFRVRSVWCFLQSYLQLGWWFGRRERRDCMTMQTFLIMIWFCILGISLGSKSDAIENAWIA